MGSIRIIWLPLFLSVLSSFAISPDLIKKISSGELKEARASLWGFNPEDSTGTLQAAINSGVPRLIVDLQKGPWITKPLKLVSSQEIIFEKGVEVLAKKGEFKAKNDSLFLLSCVSNVTMRG